MVTSNQAREEVMPKRAIVLHCDLEQRQQLEKLCNGRTTEKQLAERANIVLLCAQGKTNQQVALELKTSRPTVIKWRRRFALHRLKGLCDNQRPGKPKKYGNDLREKILRTLEQPAPKGYASWDGHTLATAVGASDDAVWRFLRKEGIQLKRFRSWCVSTDNEFAAKSADIIGLYLNPPINALVICVDEKPSIQTLVRAYGYVETSSGKIVRGMKSTYKRHGTMNLFAALNVATGNVKTQTTLQKKTSGFSGIS